MRLHAIYATLALYAPSLFVFSMCVYCIEELLSYIPLGTPFGFDDLVYCLMEKRVPIHTFMHKGFWIDIGRIEDFKKAQEMDLDNKPGVARAWEFLNDVECC
jgi:mannose-1-phosphate guanylyltransferase